MSSSKVVVTHNRALRAKYGAAGLKKIGAALARLRKADAARGFSTRVVDLSSATTMATFGGKPAATPSDANGPRTAKAAVDAVFERLAPDYLVILGAPDVVPHVDLVNPLDGAAGDDDPDPMVPSDLPYACTAPFSGEIAHFVGPTRVVGRLPDVTGASDPSFLLALLARAAAWVSRPRSDYDDGFGLSARTWKGSTTASLQKVFGTAANLHLSPTEGPLWPAKVRAARAHFVNCHGAAADPQFYGQQGKAYPVAHLATEVEKGLSEGTVAAVECCYGAELYDPALVAGQGGICSAYLAQGAYGYFGSTNVAYGPAEGNGSADLVCQFFLRRVLAGASLGRAALEARQEFAQGADALDPVDLKTLAQFVLLGDPSIHVVSKSTPNVSPAAVAKGFVAARARGVAAVAESVARSARRRVLSLKGTSIRMTQPVCARAPSPKRGQLAGDLGRLAKDLGMATARVTSFVARSPRTATRMWKTLGAPSAKGVPGGEPAPARFHLLIQGSRRASAGGAPEGTKALRTVRRAPPPIDLVVAREEGGRIVSFRRLTSR